MRLLLFAHSEMRGVLGAFAVWKDLQSMETIRIAGVIKESIVDGPGIRFVVFTQGCPHRCPGCHNQQTHDAAGGTQMELDRILQAIDQNPLLDGLTLSGGEPFEQAGQAAKLARAAKRRGLHVICYTGYTFEYLRAHADVRNGWNELLEACDVLVDGRFEQKQKDLTLRFRGSRNQRVIDLPRSLERGGVVETDF